MFFLPFSAKHALYQLRDVTQYILALGGLAVSNPGYVVFIIYVDTDRVVASVARRVGGNSAFLADIDTNAASW